MRGHLLDAAAHEVEQLDELATDNAAHREELVVEDTTDDQLDAFGDEGANAFAFAQRCDRHFQKDHGCCFRTAGVRHKLRTSACQHDSTSVHKMLALMARAIPRR